MSEDEKFILALSLVIAVVSWAVWYRRGAALARLLAQRAHRRALFIAPAVCAVGLFAALCAWSAADVRGDWRYLFMYQAFGAAWVGACTLFLPLFGISARDDVLERGNQAAVWPLSGALVGITACFAGGNFGDGPGWWVVFYCALLSTCALLFLWSIHERVTHVSEAITVERDTASGLRLAAFLVAAGSILGRAVAGDWHSATRTNEDFVRLSWPASVLLLLAILVDRMLRPTPETPRAPLFTHGLLPSAFYLAGALLWLARIGSWS